MCAINNEIKVYSARNVYFSILCWVHAKSSIFSTFLLSAPQFIRYGGYASRVFDSLWPTPNTRNPTSTFLWIYFACRFFHSFFFSFSIARPLLDSALLPSLRERRMSFSYKILSHLHSVISFGMPLATIFHVPLCQKKNGFCLTLQFDGVDSPNVDDMKNKMTTCKNTCEWRI